MFKIALRWILSSNLTLLLLVALNFNGRLVYADTPITVQTNDPSIKADGQCSLIEAIINANNDTRTYADCPTGQGLMLLDYRPTPFIR